MKLRKIEKVLKSILKTNVGLKASSKREEDSTVIEVEMNVKGIGSGILLSIVAFEDGRLFIDFFIGKVRISKKSLMLVNKHNQNNAWLKAHLDDEGYLILGYNVAEIETEDGYGENLKLAVFTLASESFKQDIYPLVSLVS